MPDTETAADQAPKRRRIPFWLELPLVVLVAVLLAFFVKTFVVQVFFIPSGSMEETLQVGDRVAVNRFVYRASEPGHGAVIVFDGVDSFVPPEEAEQPLNPISNLVTELGRTVGVIPPPDTVFVKRVIGTGGDRVKCCAPDGSITVNGEPIDETEYLFPGDVPSETRFDVTVPPGKLWVMGDHRSASADSRAHQGDPGGGFVPVDRVLGRTMAVIWPAGRWQRLPVPAWADDVPPADVP